MLDENATARPNGLLLLQRPSWDDYFFGLAFVASLRSPDLSTKHGCVLVDKYNHILGTGYNGYEPGVDDQLKATHIPKLYSEIVHAEVNSIKNTKLNIRFVEGVKAYVTGQPCLDCAEYLAEHGVLYWMVADRRGFSNPPEGDEEKLQEIVRKHGVLLERRKPDLSWMFGDAFRDDLTQCGFI